MAASASLEDVSLSDASNMTNLTSAAEPTEESSVYLMLDINFYTVPLLCLLGILGNSISVFVFFSTKLGSLSSSSYLVTLTLSDSGCLVSLFIMWLRSVGVDLYNLPVFCQATQYIYNVCSSLSVWLTVGFTTERFIAVCYPLKRSSLCTVRRARMVCAGLTIAACCYQGYLLIVVQVRNGACGLVMDYVDLANVMNYIDSFLTLVIPFFAIVILNVKIVLMVYQVNKARQVMIQQSCLQRIQNNASNSNNSQQVTRMILFVSTAFLVLNLPSHIMRIIAYIIVSIEICI